MSNIVVFGSNGALGTAIVGLLREHGHQVIETTRGDGGSSAVSISNPSWPQEIADKGPIDGIVWAQGTNASNTVLSATRSELEAAFDANVYFIVESLQALVGKNALAGTCRTVVLSSIWQDHARNNKFSYMVSKAAVEGLVKSASIDLAQHGVTMNAVLPGVIDTPMTRQNLSSEQVASVEAMSLGGSLASPLDVANAVAWLLSDSSSGLKGQFITVDQGWTINRRV